MQVARFDLSYGSIEYHLEMQRALQAAMSATGIHCAVMIDLMGPEIFVSGRCALLHFLSACHAGFRRAHWPFCRAAEDYFKALLLDSRNGAYRQLADRCVTSIGFKPALDLSLFGPLLGGDGQIADSRRCAQHAPQVMGAGFVLEAQAPIACPALGPCQALSLLIERQACDSVVGLKVGAAGGGVLTGQHLPYTLS